MLSTPEDDKRLSAMYRTLRENNPHSHHMPTNRCHGSRPLMVKLPTKTDRSRGPGWLLLCLWCVRVCARSFKLVGRRSGALLSMGSDRRRPAAHTRLGRGDILALSRARRLIKRNPRMLMLLAPADLCRGGTLRCTYIYLYRCFCSRPTHKTLSVKNSIYPIGGVPRLRWVFFLVCFIFFLKRSRAGCRCCLVHSPTGWVCRGTNTPDEEGMATMCHRTFYM